MSERELVRTNGLGAETRFAIGQTYERDGVPYRITRHKLVPTTPWATIIVYGREQGEAYVSVDDYCNPE